MDLLNISILNIYSIMLLIILGVHTLKHSERKSRQFKLYMAMLYTTALLLIVDVLGRFDGGTKLYYYAFNHIGNFFLFLLNLAIPSLWVLYVYFQFYDDTKKLKVPVYFIVVCNFTNALLLILSQFFGYLYYIDKSNIYHRGPLYSLSVATSLVLAFLAFGIIMKNKDKVEKEVYHALIFFAVPPLIGVFLQTIFYGTSLIPNSIVISLLIVFLTIQNRNIYSDYLTGIHNRKKLDLHMKEKVEKSLDNQTFSAILLDFNDFKEINDTLGHQVGDDALITAVNLMKASLRPDDFISRYGGDEFCIVLDTSKKEELEKVVERINNQFEDFNKTGIKPYKISFSMGYDVYDSNSNVSVGEFQKHIDKKMYQAKSEKI